MTNYTLDVNGRRYELSDEFREAIERRAENEYEDNEQFSCFWDVATPSDYTKQQWNEYGHSEGDPILKIETVGTTVPWDRLDQLETRMDDGRFDKPPEEQDVYGRTHFAITPDEFSEVPQPDGEDEGKLPQKPEEYDETSLVFWVPRHPDVDHLWSTGETITPVYSWVEWNVQLRADQPRPFKEKSNSHDGFESLCRTLGCGVIGEYSRSDEPPDTINHTSEKREEFEQGKYGGDNWRV